MTPWVLRLLVANVVAFFLSYSMPGLANDLVFVPALVLRQPWTPFTYMFLHAGFWHIFFNMLGLYFFGPRLEVRLGSRDFILLYLVSGLSGALLSFFFSPNAAIVGASGAVFGVLLGFAHFWPEERILIWFVIPVPARVMVIGFAILSIYSGIQGAGNIAHFAHLGGFAGAWIYLRLRERRTSAFRRKANRDAEPTAIDRLSGKAARDEKRWESIDLTTLHEINRHEVERIREKIREQGTGSLSPDERALYVTAVLDMTAEDVIRENPRYIPWAKGFDTFCSLGPVLVGLDEFSDEALGSIQITTVRNGEKIASATPSDMKYNLGYLVEYFTAGLTLRPVTVICTGTPGAAVISPGDTVQAVVEHVGTLTHPVR